jgi:uncharacterized protein YlxW (UPF0749 family)
MPERMFDPEPGPVPDEPSPAPSPESGRQRLWHALWHPGPSQRIVAGLLALVGFAAVVQLRATHQDDTYAGYRESELIEVLNGLSGTTQRIQAEIARLQDSKSQLEDETSAEQAALQQTEGQVDTLSILAGLVPVTGPGIRITITEDTGPVDIDSMLDTIQELRAAGAEAMQINGTVRVVAQSSFEDGTGGILVDDTLVRSPYVLDVIGEPHTLAGSLTFPEGPMSQLEGDGATVRTEELQSIDITATHENERPRFAQSGSGG